MVAQRELLYPELSYKLQGCFYTVYNTLGFGHKETLYQKALAEELSVKKLNHKREVSLPIRYNGKPIGVYRPDFVIDQKIIVELKAQEFIAKKSLDQLLHYLKATNYSLGYLVNFGSCKLEVVRRIWTPIYKSSIRENSL